MQRAQQPQDRWSILTLPDIYAYGIILAVAWLLFGRAVSHDFLGNWDDPSYIVNNEAVRGVTLQHLKSAFSSFYVGNYAPVQIISYMLDYSLWGLRAGGFIATDIFIHAGNGMLLYALLKRLGSSALPALLGVLVFIVHPVQVESVVWVSQRKNLLAMCFFLAALLLYSGWRDGANASRRLYAASIGAYVLALLSKSVAVVLPLLLLLHDRVYPGCRRWRPSLLAMLPFAAAAFAVSLLALSSQTQEAGGGRVPFHGGSIWHTGLTMLPVLLQYMRLVVWPSGLSAIYDPPIKTGLDGSVAAAALAVMVLVAAAVHLHRCQRQLFFWFVTFFIGLLPVSQLVPLITLMNDRYLYFPMIGVAGLCCCGAEAALAKRSSGGKLLSLVLFTAIIAALAIGSFRRIPVWSNALQLWSDTVVKSPGSYLAWYGLAESQHDAGHFNEARFAYLRSLSIKPANPEAVNNLGVLFTDMGDPAAARQFLLPLLQADNTNINALLNVGDSYMAEGNVDAAEGYFAAAHNLKPGAAKPLAALGGVRLLRGDGVTAADYFSRAAKAGLAPERIVFYKASLLARGGQKAAALAALEEAVRSGYRDFAPMAWDRSFDSLRTTPEYQRLIPAGAGN